MLGFSPGKTVLLGPASIAAQAVGRGSDTTRPRAPTGPGLKAVHLPALCVVHRNRESYS